MAEFERTFSLQVPSSTENLSITRDFVTSIANQAGMDSTEVAKIVLAVDEAVANVIEHAYERDMTKEVTLRLRFDAETLQIDVIDTGKNFDPAANPPKDLKTLVAKKSSGGLGISIIRTFMDEVHYHMAPGGKNELHMVKRLKKA